MNAIENKIVEYLEKNTSASSKEIFESVGETKSYATIKRVIAGLVKLNYLTSTGKNKSTKYEISKAYKIIKPIDLNAYFKNEIDERSIINQYNFTIIQDLENIDLFTQDELSILNFTQKEYLKSINKLSAAEYSNDLERLAIDLSWKSSQIEGNTYSLLETEMLLKEKQEANGKTKDEAIMLLNHKEAIDFIISNADYLNAVSVNKIEDIHSILIKDLGIDRNIRKRKVGISGTNYTPLDNEFQIKEALENVCALVNNKTEVFEKAILILFLLSYIQPFNDGNKRTARIVSNAILMTYGYCPLSFRTVDSIDYKKAMLLFYEQNNISAIKEIFIEQYQFAVKTYF